MVRKSDVIAWALKKLQEGSADLDTETGLPGVIAKISITDETILSELLEPFSTDHFVLWIGEEENQIEY